MKKKKRNYAPPEIEVLNVETENFCFTGSDDFDYEGDGDGDGELPPGYDEWE